jgi:hypothetical protein
MSLVTGIGVAVVFIAFLGILHVYAVRRARFLVRQQLGSFSEQRSEDAKSSQTARADQAVEIDVFSKYIQADTKTEPFGKKRKMPQKRPIPTDERRWALPN